MKSFSSLILEYDCPDCAETTEVDVTVPKPNDASNTHFQCKGCGKKMAIRVLMDAIDCDEKGALK